LRSVPGEAAKAMVAAGAVFPTGGVGRIREVQVARPAASFAERTGEANVVPLGVRFVRRVRLDESATTIYEHHPRSLYGNDE